MMSDTSEIKNVSDTALWVAYYRAKESARPDALFQDSLAQKLIGVRGEIIARSMGKMGLYTEWAVVSRTVLLDRFIQEAIARGVEKMVNLGAGLDTRPYRMSLPADFEWIEADQAQIIDFKNEALKEESPRCHLRRVTVDLADAEKRRAFLREACGNSRKMIVLTEGVVPYLSPEQVAELATDLHAEPSIVSWMTEYFDPVVYPYLQSSFRTQQMRNAPFLFFPPDFLGFFARLGWKPKKIRYTSEIAKETGRRPPMPWFAFLFRLFASRAKRDRAAKMSGYMVLERA